MRDIVPKLVCNGTVTAGKRSIAKRQADQWRKAAALVKQVAVVSPLTNPWLTRYTRSAKMAAHLHIMKLELGQEDGLVGGVEWGYGPADAIPVIDFRTLSIELNWRKQVAIAGSQLIYFLRSGFKLSWLSCNEHGSEGIYRRGATNANGNTSSGNDGSHWFWLSSIWLGSDQMDAETGSRFIQLGRRRHG